MNSLKLSILVLALLIPLSGSVIGCGRRTSSLGARAERAYTHAREARRMAFRNLYMQNPAPRSLSKATPSPAK
jgi:hypothetical protein